MQHTGFAFLHMELNVESPVIAGDTIHAECEIVEARRSRSRPDRGLVRTRIRVVTQDGAVALTYTPLRMVKCRKSTDFSIASPCSISVDETSCSSWKRSTKINLRKHQRAAWS